MTAPPHRAVLRGGPLHISPSMPPHAALSTAKTASRHAAPSLHKRHDRRDFGRTLGQAGRTVSNSENVGARSFPCGFMCRPEAAASACECV